MEPRFTSFRIAPWFFALLLPLVVAVLFADIAGGGLDAKGVAMLAVLAAGGIALELLRGEQGHLMIGRLLAPFLWVGLPAMAVVASLAVLFETLPVLRGGALGGRGAGSGLPRMPAAG